MYQIEKHKWNITFWPVYGRYGWRHFPFTIMEYPNNRNSISKASTFCIKWSLNSKPPMLHDGQYVMFVGLWIIFLLKDRNHAIVKQKNVFHGQAHFYPFRLLSSQECMSFKWAWNINIEGAHICLEIEFEGEYRAAVTYFFRWIIHRIIRLITSTNSWADFDLFYHYNIDKNYLR